MISQAGQKVQVLIVGAGPTGLALAIELGHQGVSCMVVEKNDRVGYAPRAKTTNVRTREFLRRWKIADKLRAASPLGVNYPSNVVFVTRLSGYRLASFDNAFYCAPGRNPLYSEHAQWVPQYTLEEVLRAHAETLPTVQLRFNCELKSIEQDVNFVRVLVHDRAQEKDFSVDAAYLVGADGARSTVRDAIGAKLEGTYGLSRNYNIVFHAPGLDKAHDHGQAVMYWQINGDVPSLIGPMDRGDKWFFMPTKMPEGVKINDGDAKELIHKATGIDLPYEVLSTDEWAASRFLADRYRDRRIFLAGDACHLHPPFGGYGMNMGIADGVDLGWKLAAALQGWGGPKLLDSYELERRPVHESVLDESVANHAMLGNQLWTDGLEDDSEIGSRLRSEVGQRIQLAKLREFSTLGVVLGYHYDQSPVIVSDGTVAPAKDFINYVPSARPGHRAPHAWMHDGTSLYDHFGMGFTLLVTDDVGDDIVETVRRQAHAAGVPLVVLRPIEAGIAQLYGSRLTLIRPDQHVAWRGDDWPPHSMYLFERVTGRSTNV
ncbi:FAD-dependent monooxygenase [Herbaspirillum sp. GCM10030257]|uniref:FAD-dependent monooxygenase n=1 Tax=Herbaspirillum sp. GCM10030257 TaxID=3273393 RepID=UPI0036211ADA